MYDVNTCTFCTRTIFGRYVKGVSDKRYKRLEPHAPKVKTKEKKITHDDEVCMYVCDII